MEDKIAKPCPYCGQMHLVEPDCGLPEMICGCPGAKMFQGREENTKVMMLNLEILYGEECGTHEPTFKPVDEELYALLCEIVEKVGHEEIGTVSFSLRDGTSGKISVKGIERKKSISMKLGK